jgi:hypothetical protein
VQTLCVTAGVSYSTDHFTALTLTQKASADAIWAAMGRRREQGSPHLFPATRRTPDTPPESYTPIELFNINVQEATHAALDAPQRLVPIQAIPIDMAFEWGLKAERGGASSRRQATLAIMEALAADKEFRQYARRPEVDYNVKATWEKGVGNLKEHFSPQLNELLNRTTAP